MKASLLLAWALLLRAPTEVSTEPHYAVIIPAFLQQSLWKKVCIHLSDLAEEMQLTVSLQTEAHNQTVVKKTVEGPGLFECVPFQVPASTREAEEVASVHVEGHGRTFHFEKSKKVLLKRAVTRGYIQTDKPIYKPGETVRFRIINVDESFKSVKDVVPLVELLDPENNRVAQWLNVKPKQGIVDLSFPLANEPALGTYTIKGPSRSSQTFEVKEYVLLKHEVLIEAPSYIRASDLEVSIKFCGRYTYGRPAQGTLELSLCFELASPSRLFMMSMRGLPLPPSSCKELSEETEQDGCFTLTIPTDQFNMTSSGFPEYMLIISAEFTETSTGLSVSNTSMVPILQEALNMDFLDMKSYYQKDMFFKGKMKVEQAPGVPAKNTTVYLVVGLETDTDILEEEIILPFVTNDSGMVHFSLNTSSWKNNMVSLTGKTNITPSDEKIRPQGAFRWIRPFYSESKSFLQIQAPAEMPLDCHPDHRFGVRYQINRLELSDKAQQMDFFYLVIGRDDIALSGQKRIEIDSDDDPINGAFQLELPANSDMAPGSTLIVYTIFEDGEVSADNVKFEVFPCFKNKAEVVFSHQKVRPGSEVEIHLLSTPGSLCSVRAVDRSVQLVSDTPDGISTAVLYEYKEKIGLSPRGYPYRIEDFEPYPCEEEQTPQYTEGQETSSTPEHQGKSSRPKRSKMLGPWYHSQADVYSFFKESGLKILTNTKIKEPVSCVHANYTKFRLPDDKKGEAATPEGKDTPTQEKPKEKKKQARVRSHFPETWLYDLVPMGEARRIEFQVTAPDTITEWRLDAFCMGDVGLGISYSDFLTVFQPYFVDVHLPYSVVRGEEFPLKATVFNYLRECVQLRINLNESKEFTLVSPEEAEFTHCLCNDESITFTWNILAPSLGELEFTVSTKAVKKQAGCDSPDTTLVNKWRSDTVVKSLLVKAEGVNDETIHNCMLCPSDGKTEEEQFSLVLPEVKVGDSERAFIIVWGDMMGNAVQNMGKVLQMPFGCGEQNMVLFAPIVYIMQYMKSNGHLTLELEKKAVGFMTSGYQRQLMFKHDDGSYSAFGKSDEEGNTWLTVLVLKVFSQVNRYIFVEEKQIEEAMKWMEKHQNPDGSFQSKGKLFNNMLKGALDDELSLTAYSTAALLEAGVPKSANMVKQALQYLRNVNESLDSTYNQALRLYVYKLAEEPELRQQVLEKLMESAKREGGTLHWESDVPTTTWNMFSAVSPSSVEISAYVTLGLLSGKEVTKEDLEKASHVVNWLGKHQSSQGGFVSTQDTLVGLQALAKYSSMTYREKADVTVTVTSEGGTKQEIHVDQNNRFLWQKVPLSNIPGNYTVSATGNGCVYAQMVLKYNIPAPKSKDNFALEVATEPEECTAKAAKKFNIRIEVSYVGKRASSNMVVIEVRMLTGFIPVKKTVKKLEKSPMVKKTEVFVENVIIYLEELKEESQTYTFSVEQNTPVKNLKPANVIVYDYYNPAEHALTDYNAPCSSDHVKGQEY